MDGVAQSPPLNSTGGAPAATKSAVLNATTARLANVTRDAVEGAATALSDAAARSGNSTGVLTGIVGTAAGGSGDVVHIVPHGQAHHMQPLHYNHHPGPAPMAAVLTFYAILVVMVGAQTGLFWWKKHHKRSYELVTLLGLWLFPAITCVVLKFWRFLGVWVLFSCVTGNLLRMCLANPMERSTPRKVYTWFLAIYKFSVGVGSVGYFLLLAFYFLEAFGLHHLVHDVISKVITPAAAILWIWYGLYFGILGRDIAEVCADTMSKRMGTGRKLSVAVNSCGICGQELRDFTHLGEAAGDNYEKTRQLACKHLFHDGCIRGWTIVGKKDSCPVCCEKVDLRTLYSDRPWETRNLSWIQMLDAVRYMVVWNPIILIVLHGIFTFFGIADHGEHGHQGEIHIVGHVDAAHAHAAPALAHAHSM